jgi:hypothetical protein
MACHGYPDRVLLEREAASKSLDAEQRAEFEKQVGSVYDPDGAHLHRAGLGTLLRLRRRPIAGIPHQARQWPPLISTNLGPRRQREKTTPSVSIESAQDDLNARLLLRTEPCCPLHYEPVLPGGLEPPLPASGAGVLSPGPWERAWRTRCRPWYAEATVYRCLQYFPARMLSY